MQSSRSRLVFGPFSGAITVLPFILAVLYALWFTLLLWADQAGWEPAGRWAVLNTTTWGVLGILLYAAIIILYLCLLARREVPARIYTFETLGGAPAPGFLQEKHDTQ